ncbi:MAG: AmmeMemoRadiSam system protein B [Pseudomonadota bacterium]
MKARRAGFAGSWYPAQAGACEKEIQLFLKDPAIRNVPEGSTFGGIVPHAGWYYSGSIACNVIHVLKNGPKVDTLVLFGMHLHPFSSNYIMAKGSWETPFGEIDIDQDLASSLLDQFPFIVEDADEFTQDNTIELQLPFIKYFFKDARIVPIGVPPKKGSLEIGKAVSSAANKMGKRIKIIGSTDLTHYGSNYDFTPKGTGSKAVQWVKGDNDKRLIDAVCAMEPDRVIQEGLTHQNACCAGAAAAAIAAAKALGAQGASVIGYSTSFDKSPAESFVGYVGIVFRSSERGASHP